MRTDTVSISEVESVPGTQTWLEVHLVDGKVTFPVHELCFYEEHGETSVWPVEVTGCKPDGTIVIDDWKEYKFRVHPLDEEVVQAHGLTAEDIWKALAE